MSELSAAQMTFSKRTTYEPVIKAQTVRRFLGLVFAFTAIGLWLAPGASPAAEVLLLKTGLTGVLTLSAVVALLPRG